MHPGPPEMERHWWPQHEIFKIFLWPTEQILCTQNPQTQQLHRHTKREVIILEVGVSPLSTYNPTNQAPFHFFLQYCCSCFLDECWWIGLMSNLFPWRLFIHSWSINLNVYFSVRMCWIATWDWVGPCMHCIWRPKNETQKSTIL